jgi:hypothetical protein
LTFACPPQILPDCKTICKKITALSYNLCKFCQAAVQAAKIVCTNYSIALCLPPANFAKLQYKNYSIALCLPSQILPDCSTGCKNHVQKLQHCPLLALCKFCPACSTGCKNNCKHYSIVLCLPSGNFARLQYRLQKQSCKKIKALTFACPLQILPDCSTGCKNSVQKLQHFS